MSGAPQARERHLDSGRTFRRPRWLSASGPPSLHIPFLERASEGSQGDRGVALGAFLVLRLVARLRDRSEREETGIRYMIKAQLDYLADRPSGPEISYLEGITRSIQHTVWGEAPERHWGLLVDYAEWLAREGRGPEAEDALETTVGARSSVDRFLLDAALALARVRASLGKDPAVICRWVERQARRASLQDVGEEARRILWEGAVGYRRPRLVV